MEHLGYLPEIYYSETAFAKAIAKRFEELPQGFAEKASFLHLHGFEFPTSSILRLDEGSGMFSFETRLNALKASPGTMSDVTWSD